ncbi:hypothetical protein [Cohnella laeviribosi]|uniref:hypothetical protein n=1 Tax=Cohnella laeviribosi TaxID=380174 RepID=UPI003D1F9768
MRKLIILSIFLIVLGGCGAVEKSSRNPGNTASQGANGSDIVSLKDQIVKLADEGVLDIDGVGLDSKKGKVNVYLSQDSLEQKKAKVLQYIKEDQVHWVVGDGLHVIDKK